MHLMTCLAWCIVLSPIACRPADHSARAELSDSAQPTDTRMSSDSIPNVSDTQANSGAWLDTTLVPWNTPEAPLPMAPVPSEPGVYAAGGRCAQSPIIQPTTHGDSAVTRAGWVLVNTSDTSGDVTVVTAAVDADGMCRPFKYQTFVFIGDTYAGTLSPHAMDSRTDGALADVTFPNGNTVAATFARYAQSDALCCPSRTSRVEYRLDRRGALAVAVPTRVNTTANVMPK
jgi:hypothetical protein